MKEKLKNNKGIIVKIILIVILFIIIGLIGYMCINILVSKDIKTNTTASTKKDIRSTNETKDENNASLENNTSSDTKNENTSISEDTDEDDTSSDSYLEKYVNYINPPSIGPSSLLYNIDTVNAKDLSISDKIKYISSFVYSKHSSTSDYAYNILSEDSVKSAVETVYGPNTYEKTTFNLGCGDYTLNENDHNYYSRTGCGGTSAFFASNQIIGYTLTKSTLEITTAYAFYDGETNTIYKDYNRTIALDLYNGGETKSVNAYLKDYVKTNKDKLNTLVYTFESTDGVNYYFTKLVNNK